MCAKIPTMTTTSELSAALQQAFALEEKAHAALEQEREKQQAALEKEMEKQRAALASLETAAKEASNAVSVLLRQREGLLGERPARKNGRGGKPGKRKAYNITPESKVSAATKRATTRAIKAGKSETEAKKLGVAAGKALAAKLGV